MEVFPEDYLSVDPVNGNAGSKHLSRTWEFYSLEKLLQLPDPRWLVNDIIPEGGLSVIYGQPNVGKSFLALHFAMAIACEHPVLYIASEGATGYKHRVQAWNDYHDRSESLIQFCLDAVPTLDGKAVDGFINAATSIKPVLVIVDTLARNLVGGDENSALDMGKFINTCNRIQKELRCAVLVLHHTVKEGKTERGSSALRGAADVMAQLEQKGTLLKLSCEKSKDASLFDPKLFRRIEKALPNGATSCVIVPTEAEPAASSAQSLNKRHVKVINHLATAGPHLQKALATQLGIPSSSLYKITQDLMRTGYIKGARGKPYHLTADGEALAASLS